jgi:hypothetical protein
LLTVKSFYHISDTKLAVATEKEMKDFLKELFKKHPILVSEYALSSFNPKNMPIEVAPNDPRLLSCFICRDDDNRTHFHDVKVCSQCTSRLKEHGSTLTHDKVMSYFGFGKAEAEKIKRTTSREGQYNQTIYLYDTEIVVKACKKKYGSLQQMVLKTKY